MLLSSRSICSAVRLASSSAVMVSQGLSQMYSATERKKLDWGVMGPEPTASLVGASVSFEAWEELARVYLKADYAGLEDISALEQFPDLLGLALSGCDRLTDFSPLMSLPCLEELSIQSDQLNPAPTGWRPGRNRIRPAP